MRRDIEQFVAQTGRALIKLIFLGTVLLATSAANAAFITGGMGLTGSFTDSGGADLSDATTLTLNTATGTIGTGDIGTKVSFGTPGTVNNPLTFDPSTSIPNLLQIGGVNGWQVDIGATSITGQTVSTIFLEGTGTISSLDLGSGFDPTPTTWTLSSNDAGISYSMTITAVPVPAAVWLFGSGLIGLISIARRKSV